MSEVHRILRPGGILLAVGISRFASALDALRQGLLDDPTFVQIVERDLTDGQHRNPTNHPAYFTTAFFHDPKELETEVERGEKLGESLNGPLPRASLVPIESAASTRNLPWQEVPVVDTRGGSATKRMLHCRFCRTGKEERWR